MLAERRALLEEQNAALVERCDRLEGANKQSRTRVAELERRLNPNSGNSNFPPSQNVFGLPKDEQAAAKPKTEARRGKRKGAPGAGLGLVEHPDQVANHQPQACGAAAAACGRYPRSASIAARSTTSPRPL